MHMAAGGWGGWGGGSGGLKRRGGAATGLCAGPRCAACGWRHHRALCVARGAGPAAVAGCSCRQTRAAWDAKASHRLQLPLTSGHVGGDHVRALLHVGKALRDGACGDTTGVKRERERLQHGVACGPRCKNVVSCCTQSNTSKLNACAPPTAKPLAHRDHEAPVCHRSPEVGGFGPRGRRDPSPELLPQRQRALARCLAHGGARGGRPAACAEGGPSSCIGQGARGGNRSTC
jgi:hypothetical protein